MFRMILWLRTFVFILFIISILPSTIAAAQEPRPIASGTDIPISTEQTIPTKTSNNLSSTGKPAEYVSWSLFLICNNSWLRDKSSPQIRGLYDEFMGFGRAIGARHAAVWFWTKTPKNINETTNLAEAIDANRSQAFCQKFRLDPEESPHVVVTSVYPDLNSDIGEPVILRLGKIKAQDVGAVLSNLTRQITSNKLLQADVDWQLKWGWWRQIIEQTFCSVAPSIKEITARVGVFEIKGAPAELCK